MPIGGHWEVGDLAVLKAGGDPSNPDDVWVVVRDSVLWDQLKLRRFDRKSGRFVTVWVRAEEVYGVYQPKRQS